MLDTQLQLQDRGLPRGRAGDRAATDLMWLEIDLLRSGRRWRRSARSARTPIASCESLFGRRQFRPLFRCTNRSMCAIVDVAWNGILEWHQDRGDGRVLRGQLRAAQFLRPPRFDHDQRAFLRRRSATSRIMEIDIDDVHLEGRGRKPSRRIEAGHLVMSDAPGWGVEVNEAAIRAHPTEALEGPSVERDHAQAAAFCLASATPSRPGYNQKSFEASRVRLQQ